LGRDNNELPEEHPVSANKLLKVALATDCTPDYSTLNSALQRDAQHGIAWHSMA